jgi:hypothetical protein
MFVFEYKGGIWPRIYKSIIRFLPKAKIAHILI